MEARLTQIDLGEALRYLGFHGAAAPPDAEGMLTRGADRVMETARPRAVWRRYDLSPEGDLSGAGFSLLGNDIRRHLSGCVGAILMAATLGAEVDTLLRRAQLTDMADAMVLDACASAAIENVCDNLCADLAAECVPLYLTGRFSPGYGDMPLLQQADMHRALNMQRRIGVTLSPGGLMLPQKSVTAILGLSPDPIRHDPGGCAACGLFDSCQFRKDGTTCGT